MFMVNDPAVNSFRRTTPKHKKSFLSPRIRSHVFITGLFYDLSGSLNTSVGLWWFLDDIISIKRLGGFLSHPIKIDIYEKKKKRKWLSFEHQSEHFKNCEMFFLIW